jgi:small subunit ribosomal protein S4
MVDGEIVNIPSYSLRPGQVITVREKSRSLEAVTDSLAGHTTKRYTWLEWEGSDMTGKFISYPERDQIPENVNEQLIVELYSK